MTSLADLMRPDLVGKSAYGAPQLDLPVQLNTNENAYPVPQPVVADLLAGLAAVLAGLNRYPDREFTALRAELAAYLNEFALGPGFAVDPAQVWAANGSNEVLQHIMQAFGGTGRRALGFVPGYAMHAIIADVTATEWVPGSRAGADQGFALTPESVVRQIQDHAPSLVFFASPNNPTGTAIDLEVIVAAYDASPNAIVVVDEAYAEFARPGTASAMTLLPGRERLVVTRTMSKAFAFAGARVGYLVADPEFVDALRLVRLPYHLSTTTQVLAVTALRHSHELMAEVDAIKEQRDRLVTELTALGYTPVPSDANFVLFGGIDDASATWQALVDAGVLVRDVGLPHYLRVTAGTRGETDAFLAALAATTEHITEEHRDEQ